MTLRECAIIEAYKRNKKHISGCFYTEEIAKRTADELNAKELLKNQVRN